MNYRYHKIHEALSRWGTASRQSPEHEDLIKSEVLSRVKTPHTAPPTQRTWLHIPKLALAFAVLAAIAFVVPSVPKKERLEQSGASSDVRREAFAPESIQAMGSSAQIFPSIGRIFPAPQPGVPASDTRELLKTDYSATIRTRKIQELSGRIQTTIRGFEGRVDSASLTHNTGYVSFVIPAARLDAFRGELASWVRPRFLVEQTSSQNLLPEKRALESEETRIQKEIASLQADRATLVASYLRTKARLERELASINEELTTSEAERARIQAELARERNVFESRRRSIDAQIKNEQSALEQTQSQSNDLLDVVATVRGTVSLKRINLFQMAAAYLNGYWLAAGLVLLAVISYLRSWRLPPFTLP